MGNLADRAMFGFADYKPWFDHNTALVKANRCLDCYDAACTCGCPAGINIHVLGFIKKIASDDLRGSARMILEANILGASCARVCPVEELCEGACILHDLHEQPISIDRLQCYATDRFVMERGGIPLFERGLSNGGWFALVGSGPMSLGCTAEFAQIGYEVVCCERSSLPGG